MGPEKTGLEKLGGSSTAMVPTAPRGGVTTLCLAALALLSSPPLSARMIVGGDPDLARLVDESDVICVAEVVERSSAFVNRRIETTYRVRADEYLVGSGDGEFDLTVMGGEVEEPIPIAMVFDGMVTMSEGQDVVLFLQRPIPAASVPGSEGLAAQAPSTPALQSLRVTLGDRGVLTILDDVKSGQRYVAPLGQVSPHIVKTDEVNRRLLSGARESLAALSASGHPDLRLKGELLEIGSQIAEEEESPTRQVRTPTGETVTVEGLFAQPSARSAPTPAPPEAAAPSLSGLRRLDDLCEEIRDLAGRGGP